MSLQHQKWTHYTATATASLAKARSLYHLTSLTSLSCNMTGTWYVTTIEGLCGHPTPTTNALVLSALSCKKTEMQ